MMKVNPALAQMLTIASAGSAQVGSCRRPGVLQHLEGQDVGEDADLRLQQDQPDQRGHGDRRGDGRREHRAEEAHAAQVLVGQHGEAEADDQAGRHGDEREQEGDAERVAELVGLEHVPVLLHADVRLLPRRTRRPGRGPARSSVRAGRRRTRRGGRARAAGTGRPAAPSLRSSPRRHGPATRRGTAVRRLRRPHRTRSLAHARPAAVARRSAVGARRR